MDVSGRVFDAQVENVRGESSLTALAYNIKRAITLIGVPGLIAADEA